ITVSHNALSYSCFLDATSITEIYTLSLHDALPILQERQRQRALLPRPLPGPPGDAGRAGDRGTGSGGRRAVPADPRRQPERAPVDRKSTRLNSSHVKISYAVFCLKKKRQQTSSQGE